MKITATVTSKGQITIPQEVRERLGLRMGDQIAFEIEDGVTIIKPYRGERNPFEAYAGVLGTFGSRGEINRWLAELRDEDEGK